MEKVFNYKEMVVYQIYPRSFCDSNNDGIGDIKGIISKLDYIKSLGVTAIWISPLYKSPNADYGYDISDYLSINSEYGTMQDFDNLLAEMTKRDIKCIMDLVINHTSSEHEWFKQSCSSKDNEYRDYYIWAKGNGKRPPNNWTGFFTGTTWEYSANTDEYYLHLFDKNQPDLNYANPKVIEEVKNILEFWLKKGVYGFRCDVITLLSKRLGFPNGKPSAAIQGSEHFVNGPDIHNLLASLKEVYDKYNAFTVGESVFINVPIALTYIDESNKQLDTLFSFEHMCADNYFGIKFFTSRFRLTKLKKSLRDWQIGLFGKAWNTNYWENHDQPRVVGRYCSSTHNALEGGKMLATVQMCLSGTPFLYQGQEIGMTNIKLDTIEEYIDVESQRGYKLMRKVGFSHKEAFRRIRVFSRDNARTPMQWSGAVNGGFNSGKKTWLPVNPNYKMINVESAESDSTSLLHHYRTLVNLRTQMPCLIYGEYAEYFINSRKLYVFTKTYGNEKVLVVNNFTRDDIVFKLPKQLANINGELVISNYENSPKQLGNMTLRAYESLVYKLN